MWKQIKSRNKHVFSVQVCFFLPSDVTWLKATSREFSYGIIKFLNSKLKSHQSFYPHQAEEVQNLYLFTTFQLNNVLRWGEGGLISELHV